jgi:hypothetical protein
MLLGIWILKSRAFFVKVRPDKLAKQILLTLVLYSLQQTGVIGTNIQFAARSTGSGHFSHRRQSRVRHSHGYRVLHYLRHSHIVEAAQAE